MFRLNRGRAIGLVLTTFIVYFLFLSSSNTPSDFRKRTEEGLSRRHGILQGDISDEAYRAQTNQRLNDILYSKKQEQRPLGKAPEDAPKKKDTEKEQADGDDADTETSVAGRKTMPGNKQPAKEAEKPKYPKQQQSLKGKDKDAETEEEDQDEDTPAKKKTKTSSDPGKDIARAKLQEYLKKPIVIFSKSMCPHSKRAKHLLLDVYKITPTPQVVELDQLTEKLPLPHKDEEDERPAPTLGAKIQEILYEITGRRTVPNIMVGGTTSIGGNDVLWELHEEGKLRNKIMELGGKRIVSVEVDETEGR